MSTSRISHAARRVGGRTARRWYRQRVQVGLAWCANVIGLQRGLSSSIRAMHSMLRTSPEWMPRSGRRRWVRFAALRLSLARLSIGLNQGVSDHDRVARSWTSYARTMSAFGVALSEEERREYARALSRASTFCLDGGRLDPARLHVTHWVKCFPDDPKALRAAVSVHQAAADWPSATKSWRQLEAALVRQGNVLSDDEVQHYAQALHATAIHFRKLRNWNAQDEALEELLALDADDTTALRAWVQNAEARKDWTLALDRWNRYMSTVQRLGDGPDIEALARYKVIACRAAQVRRRQNQFILSESILQTVLSLDPSHAEAWRQLAHVRESTRDWNGAVDAWDAFERLVGDGEAASPGTQRDLRSLDELRGSDCVVVISDSVNSRVIRTVLETIRPRLILTYGWGAGLQYSDGVVAAIDRTDSLGGPESEDVAHEAWDIATSTLEAWRTQIRRRRLGHVIPEWFIDVVEARFAWNTFAHMAAAKDAAAAIERLGNRRRHVVHLRKGTGTTRETSIDTRSAAALAALADRHGSENIITVWVDDELTTRINEGATAPREVPPTASFFARAPRRAALAAYGVFLHPILQRSRRRQAVTTIDRAMVGTAQVPTFALFSYYPASRPALAQVANELQGAGGNSAAVMRRARENTVAIGPAAMSDDPEATVHIRIPHIRLTSGSHWRRSRLEHLRKAAIRTAVHVANPRDKETIADLPSTTAAGASRYVFDSMIFGTVLNALDHELFMECMIQRLKPGALILDNDRAVEPNIESLVAHRHGIPSIALQSTFLSENPLYGRSCAQVNCVIDTRSRDLYTNTRGCHPDLTIATGTPRMDYARELRIRGRNLPGRPPTVLIAMQVFTLAEALNIVRWTTEAVVNIPSTHIVVRPHPVETETRVAQYRAEAARLSSVTGVDITVDRAATFAEALRAATLVVSAWSTTLLEAAIAGVDAVSVNLTASTLPVPIAEMGIAVAVDNGASLVDAVYGLLTAGPVKPMLERSRNAYFKENSHLIEPPDAAARIARQVYNTLNMDVDDFVALTVDSPRRTSANTRQGGRPR